MKKLLLLFVFLTACFAQDDVVEPDDTELVSEHEPAGFMLNCFADDGTELKLKAICAHGAISRQKDGNWVIDFTECEFLNRRYECLNFIGDDSVVPEEE